MVRTIIWPLFRLACFAALVRGGFLWLEDYHQIYVDRWVATMIGAIESMAVQAPSWVVWTLAGMVGLFATTIWEVVKHRRRVPWQSTVRAQTAEGAELKSAETERHEVRLSDALYWIIDNSDWGPGLGRDSFLHQAANALRQAAKDGEITIRGRKEITGYRPDEQFDPTWDDIDQSYWQTHEFEMTAVMCAEPHYATSETVVVSPGDITAQSLPHYAMLRVWNGELEKRWPVVNT